MTKLTNLMVAGAMSMAMMTPALAKDAQPLLQSNPSDAGLVFEADTQPMQLAVLSESEMKETEGAWWFAPAVVGGTFGSAAYYWSTPNPTWSGAGRAFGAGATAGLWGATPVHWAARAGGAAFGASSWYNW